MNKKRLLPFDFSYLHMTNLNYFYRFNYKSSLKIKQMNFDKPIIMLFFLFLSSYNNGSSRSTHRASVYSVDVTEASFGSEPEPEQVTHTNGGGLYNSSSEETIVGNGNNHELHNGVLH